MAAHTLARLAVGVCLLAAIALSPCDAAGRAAAADPSDAQASVTPGEAAILIEQYYRIYAANDLTAWSALWVNGQADPTLLTNAITKSRTHTLAFSDVRVLRLSPGPPLTLARVTVEVTTTPNGGGPSSREIWTRNFALQLTPNGWRISHDTDAVSDLTGDIRRLQSIESLPGLLDSNPELVGDTLRRMLLRHGGNSVQRDRVRGFLLLDMAVLVAERLGNDALLAATLSEVGVHFRVAGERQRALDRHARAYRLLEQRADLAGMANAATAIAGVHYQAGEYAAAEDLYHKARAHHEAANDRSATAADWHQLGNVAYVRGDLDTAIERYARSLAVQEEVARLPDSEPAVVARGLASGYRALGMAQQELGDYDAALESLDRARSLARDARDAAADVSIEEALGGLHRVRGDLPSALSHYMTALSLFERSAQSAQDPAQQATLLAEIGEVHALAGQDSAALEHFTKSFGIFERVGNRASAAAVAAGLGGVHLAAQAHDPALEYFTRSLSLFEEAKDQQAVAQAWLRIGLAHTGKGRHAQALRAYERSLELVTGSQAKHDRMRATILVAASRAAEGQLVEALDAAMVGGHLAEELEDLDALVRARMVSAEVLRQRRDHAGAVAALRQATVLVERLVLSPPASGSDGRFFDDLEAPYRALVHLLMEEGERDEAFLVLERAHQVRLREILQGGHGITRGLTAEEAGRERALRQRLASLDIQHRRARALHRDAAATATLEEERAQLAGRLAAFEEEIYRRLPQLRCHRGRHEPVGLGSVGTIVDRRTALLEFAVTSSRTYLFVATRPSAAPSARSSPLDVRSYAIPVSASDLARRVSHFAQAILKQDPDIERQGRELFALLLGPAERQLQGMRRLLIVPDGCTWMLPFHALIASNGRFVIEDHAVSYGGSLTMEVQRRGSSNAKPATAPKTAVLAVGLNASSPLVSKRLAVVGAVEKSSVTGTLAAEDEAQVIARDAGARGRSMVGAEARADLVGASASTLHLAVPAILIDRAPLHSMMAFAPSGSDGRGSEELLHVASLFSKRVAATTVVFSRAEAQRRDDVAGAALIAGSWAWFVAGAPTFVTRLWESDDASQATMARGVHSVGSARRLAASESLRLATLPLLAGQRRHPFYWAGWVVLGDL